MKLRSEANHCFVCGLNNEVGLKLSFTMDGEICRGEFTPGKEHCGYDALTHGGIIYCVLDDVMANWLVLRDIKAHTAACEIRYRRPLQIGTGVVLEGKCIKNRGRLAIMEGKMLRKDNHQLVAKTQGRFMKESLG